MTIINNIHDVILKAQNYQYYDGIKENFVTLSHWSRIWRRIFACCGAESSIVHCMKRSLKFIKTEIEICQKNSFHHLGPDFNKSINTWDTASLNKIKNSKLRDIITDIQWIYKGKQASQKENVVVEMAKTFPETSQKVDNLLAPHIVDESNSDEEINILLDKAKDLLKNLDPKIIELLKRNDPSEKLKISKFLSKICDKILKKNTESFDLAIGFANKILDEDLRSYTFFKICSAALSSIHSSCDPSLDRRFSVVELLLLNCVSKITNKNKGCKIISNIYDQLRNMAENFDSLEAIILGLDNIDKAKYIQNFWIYPDTLFDALTNIKEIERVNKITFQSIIKALPIIKNLVECKDFNYLFGKVFKFLLKINTTEALQLASKQLPVFIEPDLWNDKYQKEITEALAQLRK